MRKQLARLIIRLSTLRRSWTNFQRRFVARSIIRSRSTPPDRTCFHVANRDRKIERLPARDRTFDRYSTAGDRDVLAGRERAGDPRETTRNTSIRIHTSGWRLAREAGSALVRNNESFVLSLPPPPIFHSLSFSRARRSSLFALSLFPLKNLESCGRGETLASAHHHQHHRHHRDRSRITQAATFAAVHKQPIK